MRKCIIFFLLFMHISLFSMGGHTSFQVDFAQFQAGKDWEYLELYYSIPRDQLNYQQDDNSFDAEYTYHVHVIQNDSVVTHQTWKRFDRVARLSEIKQGQFVYDQTAFFLKPGNFTVMSVIIDQNQDTLAAHMDTIHVRQMDKSQLNISDIELAVEIKPDTMKHIFSKNNFSVIPNAGGLYGLELPDVYYYCEIYQLSSLDQGNDSTYSVTAGVFNKYQMLVKTLPKRVRPRISLAVVEYGQIDISDLPTGRYQLKIIVKDHGIQKEISRTKMFTVYNKAATQSRVIYEGHLIRIRAQ